MTAGPLLVHPLLQAPSPSPSHTPHPVVSGCAPAPHHSVPRLPACLLVVWCAMRSEARYAALLSRYLADRDNLFIISSDFCHWGSRFRYTWTRGTGDPVWQDVTWLDRQAMDAIEAADPAAFARHLSDTRNTICGRHPIGVLLQVCTWGVLCVCVDACMCRSIMVGWGWAQPTTAGDDEEGGAASLHSAHIGKRVPPQMLALSPAGAFKVAFTAYDQSSRAARPTDSSVSYAAALVTPTAGV